VLLVAACYVVLAQLAASIARRRPSVVALHLLRIMRPLEWLLLPFVLPLGWLRDFVERSLPQQEPTGTDSARLAEIAVEQVLERSEALGSLPDDHTELLWNVLEFKHTVAREIMVPRTRVVAFERSTPIAEIVAKISTSQHSRYPVYRESLDHVEGVLFAKDLFRALHESGEANITLASILRTPVFMVPEDKKIGDVLRAMQKKRVHLAVVTDEFGGAGGIVTLEDIVEEIVGEIQDEHDEEEPAVRETEPGRLVADASIGIYDLAEQYGVELPYEEGDVDSLGGLVAHVAGRVPRVGESVKLGEFELVVLTGDRQRVTTVEIRKLDPEPSAAA
jgi:CBS domain containing-hemolysin-like protein